MEIGFEFPEKKWQRQFYKTDFNKNKNGLIGLHDSRMISSRYQKLRKPKHAYSLAQYTLQHTAVKNLICIHEKG